VCPCFHVLITLQKKENELVQLYLLEQVYHFLWVVSVLDIHIHQQNFFRNIFVIVTIITIVTVITVCVGIVSTLDILTVSSRHLHCLWNANCVCFYQTMQSFLKLFCAMIKCYVLQKIMFSCIKCIHSKYM